MPPRPSARRCLHPQTSQPVPVLRCRTSRAGPAPGGGETPPYPRPHGAWLLAALRAARRVVHSHRHHACSPLPTHFSPRQHPSPCPTTSCRVAVHLPPNYPSPPCVAWRAGSGHRVSGVGVSRGAVILLDTFRADWTVLNGRTSIASGAQGDHDDSGMSVLPPQLLEQGLVVQLVRGGPGSRRRERRQYRRHRLPSRAGGGRNVGGGLFLG